MKKVRFVGMAFVLCLVGFVATQAQTYAVEPGSYMWLKYDFEGPTNLQGRFQAQGGSGNDIEVYLLSADGFTNYKNGHSTSTYYNSGRVTVGSFSVNLAAGRYYLVVNNNFSLVTNKVISFSVLQAVPLQSAPAGEGGEGSEEIETTVTYENRNIISIENMAGDTTGCDGPRTMRGAITSVITQNDVIVGFRLQVGRRVESVPLVLDLNAKDMRALPLFIRRGQQLQVSYYHCGNGGEMTPDALYLIQ